MATKDASPREKRAPKVALAPVHDPDAYDIFRDTTQAESIFEYETDPLDAVPQVPLAEALAAITGEVYQRPAELVPLTGPISRTTDPRALGCKCDQCPLGHYHKRHGTFAPVLPEIHGGEQIAAVGDHPGATEVRERYPFTGRAGEEFMQWLAAVGLERHQVAIDNAILCAPIDFNLDLTMTRSMAAKRNAEKENARRAKQGLGPLPVPLTPLEACRPHLVRTVLSRPYALVMGARVLASLIGGSRAMRKVRGAFWDVAGVMDQGEVRFYHTEKLENTLIEPVGRVKMVPTFNPAFVTRKLPARQLALRDFDRLVRWKNGKLDWPAQLEMVRNPSPDALEAFLYGPQAPRHFGVDVETDGKESLTARLRTIAIAHANGGVVIHFRSIDGQTGLGDGFIGQAWPGTRQDATAPPMSYYSPDDAKRVRALVQRFLSDPDKQKIGHNWNYFDEEIVQREVPVATWNWLPLEEFPFDGPGILPGIVWDTIVGSRCDHSELPRDLYTLGTRTTDVPAWKESNDERKLSNQSRTDRELAEYNLTDSVVTDRAGVRMLHSVRQRRVEPIVNLDFRMQHIMREMHRLGMTIDETARKAKEIELATKRIQYRTAIRDLVGDSEFNPQSDKQMRALFFGELALPILKASENTGAPSLDDDVLRAYRRMKGVPDRVVLLIDQIRHFRRVSKELSTYVLPLRRVDDLRLNSKKELVGGLTFLNGRVHPHFSTHCYDGETEILTRRGWVKFPDLIRGEPVAQWDEHTREVTFVVPSDYVDEAYTGPMVRIENQSTDLLVTPNHRIALRAMYNRKQVEDRLATALPWPTGSASGWETIHSGVYAGGCGLDLTDAHLRVLMMVQADGYLDPARGLKLAFRKDRKITRCRELLTAAGVPFKETPAYGTTLETVFYINRPDVPQYVHNYLGYTKTFGPWMLDLSRAQIDVVLEEVWHWDAAFDRKTQYSTTVKANADWVQTLLILSKNRANVYEGPRPEGHSPIHIIGVRHGRDANAWTHKSTYHQENFDGRVYCVTVPKSWVVVRRNGKVSVSGNSPATGRRSSSSPGSHQFPKHLRTLWVPAPGNAFTGADYDQIELRLVSGIAGVEAYLIVFREGGDPHATTAILIYGDVFKAALKESLTPEQWEQFVRTGSPPKANHGTDMYESLRRFAKTFVYAVIYGGTARTIYESVSSAEDPKTGELLFPDMSFPKVQAAYDAWMENAKEIPAWWRQMEIDCRRDGYVREPIMGRIRDFPEYSPTEVPNMPIQGGAAIIMARGLCRLRNRIAPDFFNYRGIVSEVHDAVTVEHEDTAFAARIAAEQIEEALTQDFMSVPGVRFTAAASGPVYNWKET